MVANSFISRFDGAVFRRLARNLAITAAVIFMLDFLIGTALRHFYFSETSGFHYRTTYAMEQTRADVLVFGSSRANHHYVPEIFEETLHASFYNTGRDGQGLLYQTALLKSILKRYTPKVIIVELDDSFSTDRARDDNLASLLPYYDTHQEVRDIIRDQSLFERIKLESRIYPFNSEILSIAIGNLDANKKRNPEHNGYVALHGVWGSPARVQASAVQAPPDPKKVGELQNFLDLTLASGAQVYVVYSPVYRALKHNPAIAIGRDLCNERHIPFFDFSTDEQFDSHTLFQDADHLNDRGARQFSMMVAQRIRQQTDAVLVAATKPGTTVKVAGKPAAR